MSTIKIKRSAIQGKIPLDADLDLGELAINTYDGKLFLKKSVAGANAIVDISTTNIGVTSTTSAIILSSSSGSGSTILGANSTTAGVITSTTQTIGGVKTFSSNTIFNGASITLSGLADTTTDATHYYVETSAGNILPKTLANVRSEIVTLAAVNATGHTHAFNDLTGKTAGTGDYTTTGMFTAATFNATSAAAGGFQGIAADTPTSPSFTWTGDLNTGMYRSAEGTVGISANGTTVATFSTTGIQMSSGAVSSTASSSRDKLRVWNSNTYSIGMQNFTTFGSVSNDYAMTFQMSNTANSGFWWGDSTHTTAQGAMSLSTQGHLSVASAIRVGYGESDTTKAGTGGLTIDVNGKMAATTVSANNIDLDGKLSGDIATSGTTNSTLATSLVLSSSTLYNDVAVVHPYLYNDIASFAARGGVITTTSTNASVPALSNANNMFEASNQYSTVDLPAATTGASPTVGNITIELTNLPRSLAYACTFGVVFGDTIYAANTVIIEVYRNTSTPGWVEIYNKTLAQTSASHVVRYDTGATNITGIRYTFINTNTAPVAGRTIRINNLFAYNGSTLGMTEYFLPKTGGTVYGQVSLKVNGVTSNVVTENSTSYVSALTAISNKLDNVQGAVQPSHFGNVPANTILANTKQVGDLPAFTSFASAMYSATDMLYNPNNGRIGINVGSNVADIKAPLHISTNGTTAGIINPASTLAVEARESNAVLQLSASANTTTTCAIDFGNSAASSVGRIRYVHSDDYMAFNTNGNERMRITSLGRVGIGAAALDAQAPLDVSGGARITGQLVMAPTSSGTKGGQITLNYGINTTGMTEFNAWNIDVVGANNKFRIFNGNTASTHMLLEATPDSAGSLALYKPLVIQNDITSNQITINTAAASALSNIKFNTDASDWELGARGSGQGGSFYLYDNTANLRRLTVDSSGRFGLNTVTPSRMLTIKGETSANTSVLMLENDTSNGWDISAATDQTFRISRYASSAFTDRVVITQDGMVGVGLAAGVLPERVLHVSGVSRFDSTMLVGRTNSSSNSAVGEGWTFFTSGGAWSHRSGTTLNNHIIFHNNTLVSPSNVGSISTTGSTTSYNVNSDYRLKENTRPIVGAVDLISQLNPLRYNFINSPEYEVSGFLAHELQQFVPEAVSGEKDAVDENNTPIYQQVDSSKLIPYLVAAIKDLSKRIEDLENGL